MAYQIDSTYRTAHHGTKVANPASFGATAREIDLSGGSKVVYNKDGVKITAFNVSHAPVHRLLVTALNTKIAQSLFPVIRNMI